MEGTGGKGEGGECEGGMGGESERGMGGEGRGGAVVILTLVVVGS